MNGFVSTVVAGVMMISPVINGPPTKIDKSVECLALNMYYEARNQGIAGLVAVTAVVLNRVGDSRFPNTICGVVYQGPTRESWKTRKIKTLPPEERKYYPVKSRCQFSWYCDGKSDIPKDKTTYNKFLSLAEVIINNNIPFLDITDGATFYHADHISPAWAKTKIRTIEIEDHIFYRWKK